MEPRYYRTKVIGRKLISGGSVSLNSGWRRNLFERLSHFHYSSLSGYYSQNGQDRFLDELVFHGKRGGVFVDIGANDGINLSNSYFFEKVRGWTGLCVEPNPYIFRTLSEKRSCKLADVCASTSDGTAQFIAFADGRNVYGRAVRPQDEVAQLASDILSVPRREINSLLREHRLQTIDYLSIDIEGGELKLFEAIDLSFFRIECVSIEDNDGSVAIDRAFCQRDYSFCGKVGCDRIYARR